MNERTIAALYDTRGAAESARDDLVAMGLSSSDVSIRGTEGESASDSSGGGFWATLGDMFMPEEDRHTYAEGMRRGGYLVSAQVPEGYEDRVADVLERHDPIDLDQRAESWRQGGWAGYDASTSGAYGSTAGAGAQTAYGGSASGMAEAGAGYEHRERSAGSTGTDESIPVVEEQVRVGKREVGRGGVRVRSYVRERPVEEQVTLRDETVRVERRPVDRPIGAGDAVFQERTIEAVERDEEAVVSKEARVVEEIAISKDVDTRTETVRDSVRRTEVEVEDERTDQTPGRVGR